MGMFDEVSTQCPKCETRLTWQSKAMQDPRLRDYPLDAVPREIARDIVGQLAFCDTCNSSWRIDIAPADWDHVKMRVMMP